MRLAWTYLANPLIPLYESPTIRPEAAASSVGRTFLGDLARAQPAFAQINVILVWGVSKNGKL
jgi:hypothetical protein